MPRFIVLTGAPLASSLRWTEDELYTEVQPWCKNHEAQSPTGDRSTDAGAPKWRSLALGSAHLHTGFSQGIDYHLAGESNQGSYYDTRNTSFFTTTELGAPGDSAAEESSAVTSSAESSEILSQFYDHSFAVHENIPSSQIQESQLSSKFSHGELTEKFTTGTSDVDDPPVQAPILAPRQDIPVMQHLSDLEDIPNAAYLDSIAPQTMTVNLIVGIISIPPPRTVTTRRYGREMQLIEMLVGDETEAGFGITFWLPREHSAPSLTQGNPVDMKGTLGRLRPRDIIMLRMVALSSFRGKVHGQSLRKNTTKVDLLHRRKLNDEDEYGAYRARDVNAAGVEDLQIQKVRRVRDWILNFVGEGQESRKEGLLRWEGTGGRREARKLLPPDTQ